MSAYPPAVRAADLRRLIAERHGAFDSALRRAQRSPGVDAVHEARVTARSLRSLLATLAPLLRPRLLARARRDLRNMACEFEDAREADVRRTWLSGIAQRSEALPPGASRVLVAELERERSAARRRLARHLRSQAFRERVERLATTLADPRLIREDAEPGGVVEARLARRWKRLKRALHHRSTDPGALHELRLAVKHARYASEALMPLLGIDARKEIRRLKRLQDCLGEQRDATEALGWLEGLGEPLGPVLRQPLEGPVGKLAARRLRELDRLAAKFRVPEPVPRRVSPGRRPAAARSARSRGPRRRRSRSS